MHKLIYTNEKPDIVGIHNEWDNNKLPTPFKQISTDKAIHLITTNQPNYIEYRQITEDFDIPKFGFIYYYHSCALFISYPLNWKLINNEITYTNDIEYYYIGCEHDYQRTRNLGNCYNEYTCTKCNRKENVDSSG